MESSISRNSAVQAEKPSKAIVNAFKQIATNDIAGLEKSLAANKGLINGLYLINFASVGTTKSLRPTTALIYSIAGMKWQAAKLLLEKGANPNIEADIKVGEPPVSALQ